MYYFINFKKNKVTQQLHIVHTYIHVCMHILFSENYVSLERFQSSSCSLAKLTKTYALQLRLEMLKANIDTLYACNTMSNSITKLHGHTVLLCTD